jgi:putative DNA primase/helicase
MKKAGFFLTNLIVTMATSLIARCAKENQMSTGYNGDSPKIEEIERALYYINAAEREIWIRAGMALKSAMGEEGFETFDNWSSSAANYNKKDAKTTWKSLKIDGAVTIATVFYLAMKNGYVPLQVEKPALTSNVSRQLDDSGLGKAQSDTDKREKAALRANAIWNAQKSCDSTTLGAHPYLRLKQIAHHSAKIFAGTLSIAGMDCNGALMLPLSLHGQIVSLQFINAAGKKRFLPGGEKGGLLLGKITADDSLVYIVEGFATGASVFKIMQQPVVVAFDAGNMLKIASSLNDYQPHLEMVFCADIDESGTGLYRANQAARVLNGLVAIPDFSETTELGLSDFNDLEITCGPAAVRQCLESSLVPDSFGELYCSEVREDQFALKKTFTQTPEVELTCAADVTPKAITWLWDGWLARGKFHLLAGQAGSGKTTIALALAAIVSSGGQFPDGSFSLAGNVLIWSGEDSIEDTLVPRLIAAGADMTRVHFIGDVVHKDERRCFDPARDIKLIEHAIEKLGEVSLLVVDPVINVVTGDSHKNGDVRRDLQPLVDFGIQFHCCVLSITHFTKNSAGREPLDRVTGSLAFGAVSRVVLVTGFKIEGENKLPVLCRAKSNCGPDGGGFTYGLNQTKLENHTDIIGSYVLWGLAIEGSAKDILDQSPKDDGPGQSAANFLSDLLSSGPLPQKEVEAAAEKNGVTYITLKRAKKKIGIISRKDGMSGAWFWSLPMADNQQDHMVQDAQTKMMSAFKDNEPLPGEATGHAKSSLFEEGQKPCEVDHTHERVHPVKNDPLQNKPSPWEF